MRLTFWGAAETVTGSRHLLNVGHSHVLVDCGLFQGVKRLRERNWDPFPINPNKIDGVVVTHAHIDHSGYLPALVRDGFSGPIWCTPATADLLHLMLLDSAHLQEEAARFHNRRGTSRHHPALPLYTTKDANEALGLLRTVDFNEDFQVADSFQGRMTGAGHILGAASVRIESTEASPTSVFFSGDVGRANDVVMNPPDPPPAADFLVVESTYGDRLHPSSDIAAELETIINRTLDRGGTVLIPSFAVGRAQAVLTILSELRDAGRIPDCPIFLNSPMSIDATELFLRHRDQHRLSASECEALRHNVRFVRTTEESKQLTPRQGPMIVISASGMATGGRVLHHLLTVAPNQQNSIVFVGFQATGTRGAALVGGTKTVRVFGEEVPVQAEVHSLAGLSAHADRDELIQWLASGELEPAQAFVVHGESGAADAFRREIRDRLGWPALVPLLGESHILVPPLSLRQ